MSTAIHLVLVTCPVEAASALAEKLVAERVAACVNILPKITSVYRWQDEVKHDDEALLIIKSPAENFERLKQVILANHPYELPEIVAVNSTEGHAPYLDWVISACK
ncbi:divalent-cation tolerance protein CutA [Stenotrophobium rhamnosiphilum]|uniref:Divalent-cation tolerance protein CutA n=1 Tax=Stenotrophobium rhamnosiphilum TaxID=2029166 RepID=A0A2T5MIF2_9GAMM|nr:divalent-cation tolerance protein CutA [Stenotrophobium rhamnosiphilum]PTU32334.1 divalent-cation tolerance protein CutA [Stenotrophobium rhamnosiphilum]